MFDLVNTCDSQEPSHEPPKGPTIISAEEAAKLLGINRESLYAAARRGEVPHRRVGRRYIFVREVLEDWLRAG